MNALITGLHHVTALAADAQKNVDFYAGLLGTRLVKKTINFDAPDVYHLYYGDEVGNPGTIITFFPYRGLVRGRQGKGQLTATAFAIGPQSLGYWMERLQKFGIAYQPPQERFNEAFIYLEDPDGLGLELVATAQDTRPGFSYGQIPEQHAIKGFHSVTLSQEGYEKTGGLLTTWMNHQLVAEQGNRFRYNASSQPGNFVDVVCEPQRMRGLAGAGTVHHLAFATQNDASITQIQEQLARQGMQVTPVLDRQYFHSIYFREPGGVLFEVATSDIGFTYDEPKAHLGEALQLPPWEQENRTAISSGLQPIQINWQQYR
jgi:glyoxalase family protein